MAIDEAILTEGQQREIPPTLRFFGWMRSALSIGYFQDCRREINCDFCGRNEIDIVRRPTGGKAVFHDSELTYSFVAHEGNPLFSSGIMQNYRTISSCLAAGLQRAGIEAALVEKGRGGHPRSSDSCCFSLSLRNELLAGGKKICGSAQLRSKGAFLQHGSILLDFDPDMTARVMGSNERNHAGEVARLKSSVTSVNEQCGTERGTDLLCSSIRESFEERMKVRLVDSSLSPREELLKERFLRDKYSTPEWNREGKV